MSTALWLGQILDWPLDKGVVQVNVVSHTGADGFWRLARQAEFDGLVRPGRTYVLVDDSCWYGRYAGQFERSY